MRLRPSSYFLIVIMICMLLMIGVASSFRYWQSAILPILFGGVVFLLSGMQLWRELTGKEKPGAEKETEPVPTGEGAQPPVKGGSLGMLAFWIGGFAVASLLLGHLIAVPIFILSYVRWRGRSWRVSVTFAAAITAFLYGLFTLALRVHLYPGLLFELILGRM